MLIQVRHKDSEVFSTRLKQLVTNNETPIFPVQYIRIDLTLPVAVNTNFEVVRKTF